MQEATTARTADVSTAAMQSHLPAQVRAESCVEKGEKGETGVDVSPWDTHYDVLLIYTFPVQSA